MRRRTPYSKPFKAQIVQECLQPGTRVSSVAINRVRYRLDAATAAVVGFGSRGVESKEINGDHEPMMAK